MPTQLESKLFPILLLSLPRSSSHPLSSFLPSPSLSSSLTPCPSLFLYHTLFHNVENMSERISAASLVPSCSLAPPELQNSKKTRISAEQKIKTFCKSSKTLISTCLRKTFWFSSSHFDLIAVRRQTNLSGKMSTRVSLNFAVQTTLMVFGFEHYWNWL